MANEFVTRKGIISLGGVTVPLTQVNVDYSVLSSDYTVEVISNTVTITFNSQESGYVVVAKGGHIVSGSIAANNIDGLSTAVTDAVNDLGVFSGSAQITMGGDVTGTANATVIASIDGGSI